MPERVLPPRPNLEQYRKQAKDLVKDWANASPGALERVRLNHPRLQDPPESNLSRGSFKLSDAQFVIAREHAFESWSKFARHLRTLHSIPAVATFEEAPRPKRFTTPIPVDGIELAAEIAVPDDPAGLVLFAHARGSGRYDPRNHYVADVFNRGALCTVLTDLLTEEEELADIETEELRLDIRLLRRRLAAITNWIGRQPLLKRLGLGYFGSGTGAAAALFAAAECPSLVQAVVSCGGRPDLAGPWLWKVQAPSLFIVGAKETAALAFNHSAMAWLPRQTVRKFEVIDGVRQLFEEKSALEKSASLACDWFCRHLNARPTV